MGCRPLLLLILSLSTVGTSVRDTRHGSCTESFPDHHLHQSNGSSISFTIHHVHGRCSPVSSSPPPASTVLEQDNARVRHLDHRFANSDETSNIFPSAVKDTRSNSKPSSATVPVAAGLSVGVGNYVIKLGVGTPSKPYIVVFDTGSSFSWIQCSPCRIRCHSQTGPIFDPKASTTYQSVPCEADDCTTLQSATLNPAACSRSNACIYQASYGDGSFSIGFLSRDTLSVGSSPALPAFLYGCGEDNQGLFGQSAGVVGFARNRFSLLAQLSPKYGYAFSYCLPTSASLGSLSVGSYDPAPYAFTPMYSDRRDSSLYFLRLSGISVAGKVLAVSKVTYSHTPTIIDSGTVITRLPAAVYAALKGSVVAAMKGAKRASAFSILDTCFQGRAAGLPVPQVRLAFEGGAELSLEPGNIMYDLSNGASCLAFTESSGSGGLAIIGNHQQLTFGVVYDVARSRIGFAAGRCR